MKKSVTDELKKLWTGEFASVVSFGMCFFMLKGLFSNTKSLFSVAYPLAVLCFILIQGGFYWWILLKRLSSPQFARKYTGKVYYILEILDIVLIAIGVPIIVFNAGGVVVVIIALFMEIFAFIEWINYYKILLKIL